MDKKEFKNTEFLQMMGKEREKHEKTGNQEIDEVTFEEKIEKVKQNIGAEKERVAELTDPDKVYLKTTR